MKRVTGIGGVFEPLLVPRAAVAAAGFVPAQTSPAHGPARGSLLLQGSESAA